MVLPMDEKTSFVERVSNEEVVLRRVITRRKIWNRSDLEQEKWLDIY